MAMAAQVAALKEAQAAMQRDVVALAAERDALAAKNEVLVTMVAEGDVTLDRLEDELEAERLKVEALKWCVCVCGGCGGCVRGDPAPLNVGAPVPLNKRWCPGAATPLTTHARTLCFAALLCRKVATDMPASTA